MQGMAAGALLPWWTGLGSARAAAAEQLFGHGVASGDPDADSVVLWTRVRPAPGRAQVDWELAEDPAFARVLRRGTRRTDASRDFTVKVLAEGLAPGGTYYYRFVCAGVASMVGRTRTLPTGSVDSLTLAVASCSNYPFGYFNGYDAIARDDGVDLLLHLGDYLYEYGPDGYGGATGARIGRVHAPAQEIVSLDDYRMRHAQYKADAGSLLMHAAHPLIAIWDDHESANNPWMGGAENHQGDAEGPWALRRAASLQAYYEWMPVRDAPSAEARADYWRHFRVGDLASIISLETRHTGRAEQIDYRAHLGERSTEDEVEAFRRDVLGAAERRMIPARQEAFIRDALRECAAAGRPWRVIANQIPMGRVQVPALRGPAFDVVAEDPDHPAHAQWQGMAALGDFDLPIYLDTWDGYPWARQRFYELLAGEGVHDALVLTGDSHAFWLNRLRDDAGRAMGVELGTTGITSPGDFADFGDDLGARIDALLAEHNPEVVWTDNVPRGWLRVTLERDQARAEYMAVSNVESTEYIQRVLKTTMLRRDGGELQIL
jgi:alkaline phosphatase D